VRVRGPTVDGMEYLCHLLYGTCACAWGRYSQNLASACPVAGTKPSRVEVGRLAWGLEGG
jgi:hypothetical protein